MSDLQGSSKRVVAILCGDIHLSDNPPLARSGEPDWFEAMGRPLDELRELADSYAIDNMKAVPILCAGDVFHKWKVSPHLINFAIDRLPTMFAVPGQHDLPYHQLDRLVESPYWTMVEFGKIINLLPNTLRSHGMLAMQGFPWGVEPHKNIIPTDGVPIDIAVIHSYIWSKGAKYPGAPEEQKSVAYLPKLKGYDAALFGDNHQTVFKRWKGDQPLTILNCGSFMRRNSDDADHRPCVGLLYEDKSVELHYLDTSQDVFEPIETDAKIVVKNLESFIAEMKETNQKQVDLEVEVIRYLKAHNVEKRVRRALLDALEKE